MVCTFVANTGAIGGSEVYLINLTSGLTNHDCRVLMPRSPAAEEFRSRAGGVRVDDLPSDGYSVNPKELARSIAFFRSLHTDVLHFNLANPSASTVDIVAAKLAGCAPIVVTTHAPYAVRSRRERITARVALSLADRVIVVCEESRRHVYASSAKASKVATVYNGVPDHVTLRQRVLETRRELGADDPSSILLGTIARLAPEKGLDCLLHAFSDVVRSEPRVRLCIVGGGSLKEELKTLAADLNIASKVMFVPWTPSYLDQIAAFDAFVLPSLCESFPFAIVEAMMAGKPVVASNVGGISEAVSEGETGLLVPPGDAPKLAERLLALAKSPELRQQMGEQGRAAALGRFSDKTMIQRTEELYEQLIAGRRGKAKK